MTDSNEKPRRPRWKSLLEWGGLIAIVLFLQFTPQGKVVTSWMQRAVLATGLFSPDTSYAEKNDVPANYDVSLTSLDGEPVSLSDFRGDVIFMNLWATWCAPCLAEMPYIQSLYEDVGSDGIRFVMISVDDTAEIARRFVDAKNYTFPVYRLLSPLPEPYDASVIPSTYVISPDGKLATVHTGMANVNTGSFKRFLRDLRRDIRP